MLPPDRSTESLHFEISVENMLACWGNNAVVDVGGWEGRWYHAVPFWLKYPILL